MADFWGQIPGGYQTPGQGTFTETTASGPSSYWYDYFQQQAGAPAPTPVFNTTNQDQARTQQMQVIQDLQRAAAGDPNSMAQRQLRDAYAGAQSQQSSLGSTMRGQSAGAAQRSIQQGQQGLQRQLPGDAQMLQLQEQQAAQQMLAQLLSQQQAQDIAQAQGMANTTLGGQALDDQMRDFYLNGMLGADIGATERQNAITRAQLGFQEGNAALRDQLIRSGMQGLGTGLATASNFGGGTSRRGTHNDDTGGSHA